METKHLTIMFTDMKGFTAQTSAGTREDLAKILAKQDEIVRPFFAQFGGTVVKTIGDAFMVVFDSPTNAVSCGLAVQKKVVEHGRANPSEKMEIRIGINSGEVSVKDGDCFGEAVNIASRVEAAGIPGEVVFSEAVYLAMNKNEVPAVEIGVKNLKGIPEGVRLYRAVKDRKELGRVLKERRAKAEASNSLSKSGAGETKLLEAPKMSLIKKIFLGIAIVIVLMIVGIILMWIFDACPPKGPWIMPPWCG